MLSSFLTVAVLHLLALVSPGPDFAMITRQSLVYSRRAGVQTAAGLALGILVHVTYCLLGIGVVISQSIVVYSAIKLLGAAYLIWIGAKALFARHEPDGGAARPRSAGHAVAWWVHVRTGFLTNALNPKATLFMLALFTQVIDPATPLWLQLLYGGYMAAATFLWFATVASVFSLSPVRRGYESAKVAIERGFGLLLVGLGLKVALSGRD